MSVWQYVLIVYPVLCAVALYLLVRTNDPGTGWWDDPEQLSGFGAIAVVGLALTVCITFAFPVDGVTPMWRAGIPVVVLAGALFLASTNWRPRSLRIAATIGILAILVIVLDIGRQALRDRAALDALAELELATIATSGFAEDASTAPYESAAADAIRIACQQALAALRDSDTTVGPTSGGSACGSTPSAEESPTLPIAMALARLRVAEYRAAATHEPADAAAVVQTRQALSVSMSSDPATAAETVSVAGVLAAGANAIASNAFGNDPAIALEAAGWIAFALVVLLYWRWVEIRSFQQIPGPVVIKPNSTESPHADDAGATKPVQEAAFRAAVLRNLTEPGALPNSSAVQPITDLLELPGVAAGWWGGFVKAMVGIVRAPRGAEISFDVVPPEVKGRDWRVLVRVSDAASGAEIDVSNQTGRSGAEACRAAGYWAAAVVLDRSPRVASWASWDKDTSKALARYDESIDGSVDELEFAIAQAPASGLLLQKLALRYALGDRRLDAISASARAVAAHPRYSVARYRLAVDLNMLSTRVELWTAYPLADRRRLAQQIVRAASAMGVDKATRGQFERLADPVNSGDDPDPRRALETMADAMFLRIKKTVRVRAVLARALRRSERAIWWPAKEKFGRHSQVTYGRWTARSLRLARLTTEHARRTDHRERDRVLERAGREWSWFQLSYNIACMYSRDQDADEALRWLETSLERPGSWQLSDRWLEVDPDLEFVRGTPRFTWLREQLHPEQRRTTNADSNGRPTPGHRTLDDQTHPAGRPGR